MRSTVSILVFLDVISLPVLARHSTILNAILDFCSLTSQWYIGQRSGVNQQPSYLILFLEQNISPQVITSRILSRPLCLGMSQCMSCILEILQERSIAAGLIKHILCQLFKVSQVGSIGETCNSYAKFIHISNNCALVYVFVKA